MNFKQQLENDLSNTFFNDKEFSETHTINGKSMNIIIDEERLKERTNKGQDGIYNGDILYFAEKRLFDKAPKVGDTQIFDRKPCQVIDVSNDGLMYEILLEYVGS